MTRKSQHHRNVVRIVCMCARHFFHVCVYTFSTFIAFSTFYTEKRSNHVDNMYTVKSWNFPCLTFSQSQFSTIFFFFFPFATSSSSYLFMCMFGPGVYRRFSTHRIWPFVLLMPAHISVCNIIYVGLLASCLCSPSISVACLVRLFAQYLGMLYVEDCHWMNPVCR